MAFDRTVLVRRYRELFDALTAGSKGPARHPFEMRSSMAKRAIDVALAGTGVVVSSPLWLLIAAAIKLEDGGPVFYAQERVGQGGRLFRVLKFRSMIPDAEARVG